MNPHGGQDWHGFLVVVGILLALAVLAYADAWWAARKVHRPDHRHESGVVVTRVQAVDLVDHDTCHHDDCTLVLCFCRTPYRCLGTVEPGCHHTGSIVCEEHRYVECEGCREDARHDAGMTW